MEAFGILTRGQWWEGKGSFLSKRCLPVCYRWFCFVFLFFFLFIYFGHAGSQLQHVACRIFFFFLIYLWLCWVFVSARGLSLVAASRGHSSSRCAGPSLSRPLLLRSTGSRRAGSVIVAHGPSCSAACGILPDQGSNPCALHWQTDSQPLCRQGSPLFCFSCRGDTSTITQS